MKPKLFESAFSFTGILFVFLVYNILEKNSLGMKMKLNLRQIQVHLIKKNMDKFQIIFDRIKILDKRTLL